MGLREITPNFGRLLQALGVQGGKRIMLRDELVPVASLMELRHFSEAEGAVLCVANATRGAAVALRGHYWIDRGTASKVIPLAFSFTAAANFHLVPPGTVLDGDVAAASVTPQTFLGIDYTPVSRLAHRDSASSPANLGFVYTFGVSGVTQDLTALNMLSFGHVSRGGFGGSSGRFHLMADTVNVGATVSVAWLEVP